MRALVWGWFERCRGDVLRGSNIEDTVAKGTECDGGVAQSRLVGECHFQDCDVANDRRGDGGDEKQNCGCEEEEGTNMVEDTCLCHVDGSD